MSVNIAIDGPAGAGKSTIARRLAKELGYIYVDTGAMFRAMAWNFLQKGIDPSDEAGIAAECGHVEIALEHRDGQQCVILNGENVNGFIRTEEVGRMASAVSVYPVVREKLKQQQQRIAETTDLIMDGRDIGTVVLPNADVKIFLTASSAVRAKRRYDELVAKGEDCDLAVIEKDIIARDNQDMNREVAPLRQAEDAVLLDSSDLDIDGVIARMRGIIDEKRSAEVQ